MNDGGRIVSLHIHPVKGGRAVDVESVNVQPRGFEGDRRWLIVDASNRFISQREEPLLTQLIAERTNAGLRMTWGEHPFLESFGACDVSYPTPESSGRRLVGIWDDTVAALDAGDAPADWLSERLDRTVRLVHMHTTSVRKVDPAYAPGNEVSFADGYPVLVIGTASLERLQQETGPLPMNRFRPNMVVETDIPWVEDGWERVQVGTSILRLVKPCARCVVTTIDQVSGEQGKEPLRALARIRKQGTKVLFGMNAVVEAPGRVTVGDMVSVVTL